MIGITSVLYICVPICINLKLYTLKTTLSEKKEDHPSSCNSLITLDKFSDTLIRFSSISNNKYIKEHSFRKRSMAVVTRSCNTVIAGISSDCFESHPSKQLHTFSFEFAHLFYLFILFTII